ncbi:unnamed protein product [Didymodactylos carnosus]|uniref:Uncharacterized protein n=1 Tax=Didymodactylos carnosus TaxID=1234261 RepID=A0A815EYY3_9BILA|nr:unnamed protein product [Didymodactylos carnosus]CAF4151486.1 unnamed protein product [Didymodactylos carnosus]
MISWCLATIMMTPKRQVDQVAFYKEKLQYETLIFYFVNNQEFDHVNFNQRKQQAETLCRAVTQLKQMKSHYPSPKDLEQILSQQSLGIFGDEHVEQQSSIPARQNPYLPFNKQNNQLSALLRATNFMKETIAFACYRYHFNDSI